MDKTLSYHTLLRTSPFHTSSCPYHPAFSPRLLLHFFHPSLCRQCATRTGRRAAAPNVFTCTTFSSFRVCVSASQLVREWRSSTNLKLSSSPLLTKPLFYRPCLHLSFPREDKFTMHQRWIYYYSGKKKKHSRAWSDQMARHHFEFWETEVCIAAL